MMWRYQPLYEDPEYYGDESDGWDHQAEPEEQEQTDLERPLYINLRTDREIKQMLG